MRSEAEGLGISERSFEVQLYQVAQTQVSPRRRAPVYVPPILNTSIMNMDF